VDEKKDEEKEKKEKRKIYLVDSSPGVLRTLLTNNIQPGN
jgi:hypothetical protein